MKIRLKAVRSCFALPAAALLALPGHAQLVINDTLSGASSSYNWRSLNGACLTAGDGTGTIPACVGLSYYGSTTLVGGATGRLPDTAGNGALRLTNGDTTTGSNGNYQTGAVVSNFTFPTNQGIQVTFKTVTYGGNAYTNSAGQRSGADGISFFLSDGAQTATVGASGGSLGYSCSNGNPTYDGVIGGYIGLGIDEYGNFSNPGDNTASGGGAAPSRIALRGGGSIAFASLNQLYPTYYPSSMSATARATAVKNTCKYGKLYNNSGGSVRDANNNIIANGGQTTESVLDYPFLAYSNLPSGVTIYNQEATNMPTRGAATPITYALKITQDGLLSLSYSVNGGAAQPLVTNQSIVASNGPLPSSFRFGFSAGTGGGSNVHEIMCFKAAAANQSSSSAGANIQQSSQVKTGSQVFSAFYQPTYWTGSLVAQNLVYDSTSKTVSVQSVANWDAGCVLTGGTCSSTNGSTTAQGSGSRNLLTWNGSAGIPFQWASLTTAQKNALTAGDVLQTSARLDYLRGSRSNEITTLGSGLFRARTSVLGDIIDSSPVFVGAPSQSYDTAWSDFLYPSATAPEGSTYATFKSSNATRTNVVYVGANDGFLHGFRAGAYGTDGNYNASSTNDGSELIGYMPSLALNTIHSTTPALDYASAQYGHNYFVDAAPGTGDLYYNGAWHTWLVGGLGAGGNAAGPVNSTSAASAGALYILDVTNPSSFSETNASTLVIGEWTAATLSCTNNATCGTSLGSIYGTPLIRRLHNGQWAVIFGNGVGSATGTAGVYIMTINPSTGAKTVRFLDTGYGPSRDPAGASNKNGIVNVSSADYDGDHVSDYLYAGDLFGNLWRFDLTSDTPGNWSVGSAPMFSTGGKPIWARVAVASAPIQGNTSRALVEFATGRPFVQTQSSDVSYASGTQTVYGVWDWNMSAWNTSSGSKLVALTAPQSFTSTNLQTQTVTATVAASGSMPAYRTLSSNIVCWQGSTTCSSGNSQFGWKLDLPGSSEQVIYNPSILLGMLVLNSTIPSATQALSCDTQPPTGFTMSFSALNGGASTQSFFPNGANNTFSTSSGTVVNGVGLGATGAPYLVTAGGSDGTVNPYLVQQTTSGTVSVIQTNPYANGVGGRINWINLR